MTNLFDSYIDTYRKQLESGDIQKAYRGLIDYMMALKSHLIRQHPDYVAGHFYPGYLDVTYFSFTPELLKSKQLKIVIVLEHEKMQFVVCLAGQNKQISKHYREVFKENSWQKYAISSDPQVSVVESVLVATPSFGDLDVLTEQIETKVVKFSKDMLDYLG